MPERRIEGERVVERQEREVREGHRAGERSGVLAVRWISRSSRAMTQAELSE
jgi:hypothetical protein